MGWENSKGQRYYIVRRKVNGKVIRRSGGKGEKGRQAEIEHLRELEEARLAKLADRAINSQSAAYEKLVILEVSQALTSEGLVKRNNRWTRVKVIQPQIPPDYTENFLLKTLDAELREELLNQYDSYVQQTPKLPPRVELAKQLDELGTSLRAKSGHPIEDIIVRQAVTFYLEVTICDLYSHFKESKTFRTDSPYFYIRRGTQAQNRFERAIALLLRVRSLVER